MPKLRSTMLENANPTLARFLECCHIRQYKAKETIIDMNAPADNSLYYIVKGSVAVIITDTDEDGRGKDIVLSYLNPGDFFGEMGLFDDAERPSASIVTKTEVVLATITYANFRKEVKKDPEIMFSIAGQLADRLRKTNRRLENLATIDVMGRVARTLRDLSNEPDAITHPDGKQIRITRQEISRIAGCSREMVGRMLKRLAEWNMIDVKGKTIVVFHDFDVTNLPRSGR
jgi:CRP/FNR family cyclic AMP-dependent transcriptional regulator